ncbi:MAG: Cupin 2 conserved barrel domain protein [Verrucomicrobiales bacterium]|nr:Cupin 2 conserved barrel domain protein [Verrucomicrobiales bacterium]
MTTKFATEFATLINKPQMETFLLQDDTLIPNSRWPLLIYRRAVKLTAMDPAETFEELFASNHWTNSWRDGIYPFHHYHSTTHEVLGVYNGSAEVQFGGENGIVQKIYSGDVIVIPAGVAHKNRGGSEDFSVVGAYPDGKEWDINYGRLQERPRANENLQRVELPRLDPVYGESGPLLRYWKM